MINHVILAHWVSMGDSVTQLSASFLLDSWPKFLDQFSVVDTSNSLASLQVVNHQHPLAMPEYRRHDFASRRNPTKLDRWRQSDMFSLLASLLGLGIKMVSPSFVHGDTTADKLRWIWWKLDGNDVDCHVKWSDGLACFAASAFVEQSCTRYMWVELHKVQRPTQHTRGYFGDDLPGQCLNWCKTLSFIYQSLDKTKCNHTSSLCIN